MKISDIQKSTHQSFRQDSRDIEKIEKIERESRVDDTALSVDATSVAGVNVDYLRR